MRLWALSISLVLLSACASPSSPLGRRAVEPQADAESLRHARRIDGIETALAAGDLPAAERLLQEGFAAGMRHPRASYLQARLILERPEAERDVDAAIGWLIDAIEQSPVWPEPRLLLAETYLDHERLRSAAGVYAEIDQQFPEHPAGPYGRGRVALLQHRLAEAREYLDQSLERSADYAPALHARAILARLEGDRVSEERFLRLYLQQRSGDAGRWAELGQLLQNSGRPEDARRAYERSYHLQPTRQVATVLGDLARSRGDLQAAQHWWREAGITPRE